MTDKDVASLIVIGDEILRGQVQDANTMYLAKSLQTVGIKIRRMVVIPDEVDVIAKEVSEASKNYPIVFTSGGVGPTHDDLTYEGVAKGLGLSLKENQELREHLDRLFPNKPESRRLAVVPNPCELIYVDSHTSTESYAVVRAQNVYVLPGSPRYFRPAVDKITPGLSIPGYGPLHIDNLDIELDEFEIVAVLEQMAERWRGSVAVGSYPQSVGDHQQQHQLRRPLTRISLEARDRENLAAAKRELINMLPIERIVRGIARPFDDEYARRVHESAEELGHVARAFEILDRCYDQAKPLRTPSNMFVVNLAICDFFMMIKTPIFIYNSFNTGFALGNLGCQIFGVIGSLTGIGASMTNAAIAYDRYSTIAHPLDGKLSRGQVMMLIVLIWTYVFPWALMPIMGVWGRFVPEGFLTSCTFDYLTDSSETRYFVGTIFTFSYVIPMSMIIYFYSQIVGHVVNHEKALREQAKKMNVESLRSGQGKDTSSAEVRIAKAAITICFLFVASWTPYGVMSLIGAFGNKALLTPGVTMIPACTCKAVACLDPYVYAISHPRYRLELQKRMPWLELQEKPPQTDTASTTTEAVSTTAAS